MTPNLALKKKGSPSSIEIDRNFNRDVLDNDNRTKRGLNKSMLNHDMLQALNASNKKEQS